MLNDNLSSLSPPVLSPLPIRQPIVTLNSYATALSGHEALVYSQDKCHTTNFRKIIPLHEVMTAAYKKGGVSKVAPNFQTAVKKALKTDGCETST